MGRRKTPQEKKKDAYEKDVVSQEEYPKSKAIGRARAKAAANRAHRRKVKERLADTANPEELEPDEIGRRKVWKTQVAPLGEAVEAKLEERRERIGWNFFKRAYTSDEHREDFAAFLGSVVDGRTEESYDVSLVFEEMLSECEIPASEPTSRRNLALRKRVWLRAFFEDEPEWEERLRGWIEEMRERHAAG